MKTLLILRHAKSSWDDPKIDDHDRPLNSRGLKTAPLMGQLIKEQKILPDAILSSTALRAKETANLVAQSSGFTNKITTIKGFYPGDMSSYIEILRKQSSSYQNVMIIAHNPGLEIFVEHLTGLKEPLATAALAQVQLPIDSWSQLTMETKGTLVNVYRPREIFKNLDE